MKKNLISIMAILFVIALSIFACTKHDTEMQLRDQTLLNEDENFISMVQETKDYLEFLALSIKSNSLKKDEINNGLTKIQNENLSFDEQMKMIDILYKKRISIRLKSHMIMMKENMSILEKNFGKIDSKVLNREVEKVILKMAQKNSESDKVTLSDIDCSWRYYGCSVAATAGAVLCHAGCDTTALATTAGLGIPACVLACGTLQAWAIVECSDRFCH